ncbi:MAG: hypothetical protein IPJ78_07320 [Gemmatimonadetes bacterium]|nr:hypothetical protein [Gemmatimonadota bacterium]
MRTATLIVTLAATLLAPIAAAQDPAAAAAVARAAFRRAAASTRAAAHDSAYADVRRAHAAWPMQPAYGEALAVLAAQRHDDTTLTRVLATLAAEEAGAAVLEDSSALARAAQVPAVAHALATLRAAIAPTGATTGATTGEATERTLSPDTTFFPEGLDADPRDGTLYVTSLRHRNVLIVPRTGPSRWLLAPALEGRGAVMGVALDTTHGDAWLTTAALRHMGSAPGDSLVRSELLRVRLVDGTIISRHLLGDGKGTPGELTRAPNGDLLVSDAVLGRLYRLRAGASRVEVIASPLLRSPQGIAVLRGDAVAVVADWSHGLLRWDLRTDSISAIAAPPGVAVLGIDGLRASDDRLIAVQNGIAPMRVAAVTLSADARRIATVRTLDRAARTPGEITVGAIAGDRFVYIASSAWSFWADEGTRAEGSGPLPAVIVREVPLRR